jgi:hypothetical protein
MIRIGSPEWGLRIREMTEVLGKDFWSDFTPVSSEQIRRLENDIHRTLPQDFKEFYSVFGYGQFSMGGDICSPDEIVKVLGAPIYFVTGSMTPGKEWATEEQHRELWRSRGLNNPCPQRFTSEALTFEGVFLCDLLQFGSNGSCCYHQLYVGTESVPFRYCLLTDYETMEDRCSDFSEALDKIISSYLKEEE